jgi:hypothetical protein
MGMGISRVLLIVVAVIGTFLMAMVPATARGHYPRLTICGPSNTDLCTLHGYFDLPPFNYSLAVHPACIKWEKVQTAYGIKRRPVLVCG